jgi:hypothetical protein
MYGAQRRFFSWMTVGAALFCLVPVALGAPDIAIALAPVLLVYGLLVCGRYVGEERILALRQAVRRRLRRPPRRLPRPAPARPLASLLHRRPHTGRGPPIGVV